MINYQTNEALQSGLTDLALTFNGKTEFPTREEFFTNYPFFKYWNNKSSNTLFEDEGINIYIHIPFCIQLCDYCFYMKDLVKSKEQVNEYIDMLCLEIEQVSKRFNLAGRRVNSIYVGGGTPSVLTEDQLNKLADALHRHHTIEHPEFTFEAEPGTFTRVKLKWYKQIGVNRISMGIQSFNDQIIKLSSRKHTSQQALNSIAMVQEEGGFHVNIDLLSGLLGETMDTWKESVETALSQDVDMITIYKMKTYTNTTFFKKGVLKNDISLPSFGEEIELMEYALGRIRKSNYSEWTNFAFSKDGYKNNYAENTWRGQDLIAYGASSFGKIGNVNYQNINNIELYQEHIKKNELPVFRTFNLTCKDMMIKELLLCAARLKSYSKTEFIRKFGFDYMQLIPEAINQLRDKKYISTDSGDIELTDQGIIFGDFVGKVIASAVKNILGDDNIGFSY